MFGIIRCLVYTALFNKYFFTDLLFNVQFIQDSILFKDLCFTVYCLNLLFFREKKCIPVCQQGCVHGTCVLPDVCRCDFGYVGNNCMVECECHKHSNCESVDKKKNCSLCHNNTQVKILLYY